MEGYIMYKVKKKETFIPSSNGKDKLHVIVWEPQGEIRAILQISHGMIELIIFSFLCQKCVVVAALYDISLLQHHDHIGVTHCG